MSGGVLAGGAQQGKAAAPPGYGGSWSAASTEG